MNAVIKQHTGFIVFTSNIGIKIKYAPFVVILELLKN